MASIGGGPEKGGEGGEQVVQLRETSVDGSQRCIAAWECFALDALSG